MCDFWLRERPTKQRKWKGSFHSTSKKIRPFPPTKNRNRELCQENITDGRVVFRKGLRVAETMTLEWIKYFRNSSSNSSISGQGSDPTVAGLLVPSGAKVPFVHPTGLSGKWARPRWLVLLSPFQSPPHSPCETRDFSWRVASQRCNTHRRWWSVWVCALTSGPVGVCG